jgi:hypothetical protein
MSIKKIIEYQKVIEDNYLALEKELERVVPIYAGGSQKVFYLYVSYSRISNKISASFLAPSFGIIRFGGSKYERWHVQYQEMKRVLFKWARSQEGECPFEKNDDFLNEFYKRNKKKQKQ